MLSSVVKDNIGVLMVSETKLNSFPQLQFITEEYSAKEMNPTPLEDFEGIFAELNLCIRKIDYAVLITRIKSGSQIIFIFSGEPWMSKWKYKNSLIIGDFNSEITESAMEDFCETYHFYNLIKDPTSFKILNKSSCINLILTNFSNIVAKWFAAPLKKTALVWKLPVKNYSY